MKDTVAILGTSPIMIILAYELLNKGADVTILDFRSEIGGAWSCVPFKNSFISTQTNVIVPDSRIEERNIPKLNRYLTDTFKVDVTENNEPFEPLGYLAKTNYDYDLRNIYRLVLEEAIPRKKIFVERLVLNANKVAVDDENEFDKVYVPTYCGVSQVIKNGTSIDVRPTTIVSEHALLISKKINATHITYSENFDDNFDRVQIKRVDAFDVFTGRIRREKKGQNVADLVSSSKLVDDKATIELKKFRYKNFYRNKEQKKRLKDCLRDTNVEYINTALFVEAFFELNQKFKMVPL